jgi:hypothetical protein
VLQAEQGEMCLNKLKDLSDRGMAILKEGAVETNEIFKKILDFMNLSKKKFC